MAVCWIYFGNYLFVAVVFVQMEFLAVLLQRAEYIKLFKHFALELGVFSAKYTSFLIKINVFFSR